MTYATKEPPDGWYQPEPDDGSTTDERVDSEGGALVLRPGTVVDDKMGLRSYNTSPDEIVGLPVGKGHAGLGRAPVVVLGDPPARRKEEDLPGGRRPVVAVLDTFVDPQQSLHPWLAPTDGEDFVADVWVPPGRHVPPARATGQVDSLGKAAGHGTFIAGLIRQLAPDAEVIMMRIMEPDHGEVDDSHLRQALEELLKRVQAGASVDIVCLALGFHMRTDSRDDNEFLSQLRRLLGELGNLGVRVVASAGNDGTTRRVYPAALATAGNKPRTGLISVGSYDPDGVTPSTYSPKLPWITHREIGTLVVSTMPAFNGPQQAAVPLAPPHHPDDYAPPDLPYDPDDYSCGFARWSGTSFAAGVAAGRLARALVTPPLGNPALDRHECAAVALAALTPLEAC
jgi:hypothetical protein